MVRGLDTFRNYFKDFKEQYVLIGGAACDILFANNEGQFRATRDLDMVLIVEALTTEFGERFWDFIVEGKYQNKTTNTGTPQFYRFDKPENELYPKMIELFAKTNFELKSLTKCNKSQEKFLFLPIFIMTTSSKFEGDSHLDPVPYGAVALRESGGIIVPQTPKGGFNFIKAKKERPT